MNDWIRGGAWVAVLLFGIAAVTLLHRAGLARTYARDLLHVGAGTWVLGWPWWMDSTVPLVIVWTAFVSTALVPVLLARSAALRRIHGSIAGEGERWSGVVAYAASFAALTTLALSFGFVQPAALAVAALSAGDGLGGLIGRRFGRHRYALPWSKSKTWEGTAAVAVFSLLGFVFYGTLLDLPVPWGQAVLLGFLAAAAEALAPRATDNVVVPAAVFVAALAMPLPV